MSATTITASASPRAYGIGVTAVELAGSLADWPFRQKVYFPAPAGREGGSPDAGTKIVDCCDRYGAYTYPLSLSRIVGRPVWPFCATAAGAAATLTLQFL